MLQSKSSAIKQNIQSLYVTKLNYYAKHSKFMCDKALL